MARIMEETRDPELLQDAEKRMEDLLNRPRLDPDAMHTLALTELKLGELKRPSNTWSER